MLDYLDLKEAVEKLSDLGIRSVMVEGGALVINSFLEEKQLVDVVVLTIAPKYLGSDAVVAESSQVF